MRAHVRLRLAAVSVVLLSTVATAVRAQTATIADYLTPPFPFDLVSATGAERIAWIAYERGMRNVYTAASPDFEPVRLTENLEDDGVDLSGLQISGDGEIVAYLRGHDRNDDGWVANPTSDPHGA
ncbi:MAG: hypothetical protein ACRELX_05650, partial [Longimicrobiales bacterium]